MTVWDWLSTPSGTDVVHVLVLLAAAAAAVLSAWAARIAQGNAKMLNGHLRHHERSSELSRHPPQPTGDDPR